MLPTVSVLFYHRFKSQKVPWVPDKRKLKNTTAQNKTNAQANIQLGVRSIKFSYVCSDSIDHKNNCFAFESKQAD